MRSFSPRPALPRRRSNGTSRFPSALARGAATASGARGADRPPRQGPIAGGSLRRVTVTPPRGSAAPRAAAQARGGLSRHPPLTFRHRNPLRIVSSAASGDERCGRRSVRAAMRELRGVSAGLRRLLPAPRSPRSRGAGRGALWFHLFEAPSGSWLSHPTFYCRCPDSRGGRAAGERGPGRPRDKGPRRLSRAALHRGDSNRGQAAPAPPGNRRGLAPIGGEARRRAPIGCSRADRGRGGG